MATVTARRSLLSRILRFVLRRKDPIAAPRRRGDGTGNAGVREPRRPSPAPPALSAEREP